MECDIGGVDNRFGVKSSKRDQFINVDFDSDGPKEGIIHTFFNRNLLIMITNGIKMNKKKFSIDRTP